MDPTSITSFDVMCHLVEVSRAFVLVHVIQSLYGTTNRNVTAVIVAVDNFSVYCFLRMYASKFLEKLISPIKYNFVICTSSYCSSFIGQ